MGVLRRLDDRVVPALGNLLRGTGRAARRTVALTGSPGRAVGRAVSRFPVATAAVVMIAAAAALISTTGGDERSAVRPKPSTVVPSALDQRLGPAPGASVASYLAAARLRLQQLGALPAGQRVTAIVDLTAYLTPQAAATSLTRPGLTIRHAFARVPGVATAPIHTLNPSSPAGIGPALAAAHGEAQAYLRQYRAEVLAESQHPSPRLEAAIRAARARVAQAAIDARELTPTCGCVFALLVDGPAGQLLSLSRSPDVRAVDPAPPAAPVDQLMVVPLEPQVTGVVPQPEFAVG
jgi:hypothetical protein